MLNPRGDEARGRLIVPMETHFNHNDEGQLLLLWWDMNVFYGYEIETRAGIFDPTRLVFKAEGK